MSKQLKSTTIDVDTGEIGVSLEGAVLQSIALGSCVALAVFEREREIGGMAHIMLPERSPKADGNTKYAEDAIDALLDQVKALAGEISNLEISVVGGANVLQKGDIPDKVIESVLGYLKKLNLEPTCMRIGGIRRRSAFLDATTGFVFYTEGDDPTKIPLTKIERI